MRRPLILLAATATLSACNVPVLLMSPGSVACDPAGLARAGFVTVNGRATVPVGFYLGATGTGDPATADPAAEQAWAEAEVTLGDTQGNAIPGLPTGKTDANGGFSVPDVPSSFSYVVSAKKTIGTKTVTLKSLARTSSSSSSSSSASSTSITLNAATTLVTEAITAGRRGVMRDYSVATYDKAVAIVYAYIRTGDVPDLSNQAGMRAWINALSLRLPELRTALDALVLEIYGPLPSPSQSPAPSPSASPSAAPSASASPSAAPTASPPPATTALQVETYVGTDGGYQDGLPMVAQFNLPTGLLVVGATHVFLADTLNHAVRRVGVPDGEVATFAGNGDEGYLNAQGGEARFSRPTGIARDAQGNLYVSDTGSHRIRRIGLDGTVSLLAGSGLLGATDGTADQASFSSPGGLAFDGAGNLYVADSGNHRIRKISPEGVVSTLAGSTPGFADGVGTAARFNDPEALAWDPQGFLYVSDTGGHRIRRISADGTVSTLAGVSSGFADGPGATARFKSPRGLALSNGRLLIADEVNHRIRSLDLATNTVTTLAGNGVATSTDGPALSASFRAPAGLAVDTRGWIYVTEPYTHRVRVIR